jgi:hypothetical protein
MDKNELSDAANAAKNPELLADEELDAASGGGCCMTAEEEKIAFAINEMMKNLEDPSRICRKTRYDFYCDGCRFFSISNVVDIPTGTDSFKMSSYNVHCALHNWESEFG